MIEHANTKPVPPRRVVVVGAGGFVGGAIAAALTRDGVPILALTRNEIDLLVDDAASRLSGYFEATDAVMFVSAIAPARNSAQLIQNLQMARAVGNAVAARPVTHFVYVSSDAVYSDDSNPVTERSFCQPSTMHGMMHFARELILRSEIKVPQMVLRPSLLYGANDPHNGYGPNRFRRLVGKSEPIVLFGDGEEMRDHVYVDDVGRLATLVLAHRSTGVLNIATGVSTSFRRVAEMVAAQAAKPAEIRGTPRQNPITHRHFDITACLKAFPQFRYTPLAVGLKLSQSAA